LTAQVMYNSILAKEAYLLCYDIVVYVSYLWPALNYRKVPGNLVHMFTTSRRRAECMFEGQGHTP